MADTADLLAPAQAAPAQQTAATAPSDAVTMVRQIAHELRQPLSTIESIAYYLDLILPGADPRARQQIERLRKLVEQSNWIVSNAVHFVQASPAAPQYLDLEELMAAAAADCPAGAEFRVDMPSPAPLVYFDAGQADHLLRTLLAFLRQIAPAGYAIQISASKASPAVLVEMSTDAPGFTPSQLDSMFEPYGPAGSGLSLASVRRILEAHGGSMAITADPHTGVRISLQLPG